MFFPEVVSVAFVSTAGAKILFVFGQKEEATTDNMANLIREKFKTGDAPQS